MRHPAQVVKTASKVRFICDVCIDRVRHKAILGQLTFLDAAPS